MYRFGLLIIGEKADLHLSPISFASERYVEVVPDLVAFAPPHTLPDGYSREDQFHWPRMISLRSLVRWN